MTMATLYVIAVLALLVAIYRGRARLHRAQAQLDAMRERHRIQHNPHHDP